MTDISDGLRAARDVLAHGAQVQFATLRELLSEAAADPNVAPAQRREAAVLVLELQAANDRRTPALS